jgi:hypothetical protein
MSEGGCVQDGAKPETCSWDMYLPGAIAQPTATSDALAAAIAANATTTAHATATTTVCL